MVQWKVIVMVKDNNSIDGFVRRPRSNGAPGGDDAIGGLSRRGSTGAIGQPKKTRQGRRIHVAGAGHSDDVGISRLTPPDELAASRQSRSIGESMDDLVDNADGPGQGPFLSPPEPIGSGRGGILRRRGGSSKPGKKPRSRRRRIIKWTILIILLIGLAIGGFLLYRAYVEGSKVFGGNILSVLTEAPLKKDANGRTNILIFGTAEDDEGGTHDGKNLTDSLMVLSVSQDKKDAYMVSIPRDLWVKYNQTCSVGTEGKINAVYLCASGDGQDQKAGAAALQSKITEVTGLEVQYYAHVNFSVVVGAVDAVGGVDVTVETDDPRGILDRNFDWKCNYKCYYVKYAKGQRAHMDGEHALAFSRARNAQGGYGLGNGNFDRERNQQKVIVALREKAMSVGTLTDIGKVMNLMKAMGDNLRTNLEAGEARSLLKLTGEVGADKTQSISLVDEKEPVLTTGTMYGQSIVRPINGVYSYSGIKAKIRKAMSTGGSDSAISKEQAKVMVFNASGRSGAASAVAQELEENGITNNGLGNVTLRGTSKYSVYKLSGTRNLPATEEFLKKTYGVSESELAPNAVATRVAAGTDFIIVVHR